MLICFGDARTRAIQSSRETCIIFSGFTATTELRLIAAISTPNAGSRPYPRRPHVLPLAALRFDPCASPSAHGCVSVYCFGHALVASLSQKSSGSITQPSHGNHRSTFVVLLVARR